MVFLEYLKQRFSAAIILRIQYINSKGREFDTVSGHYQEFMIPNIIKIKDDRTFSVTDVGDENSHGLENHACFNTQTGIGIHPFADWRF